METLRTSELGKRLQEEWPESYTSLQIELDCHVGSQPRVGGLKLYHERVSWHFAPTFEGCIAKVKEALAVLGETAKPSPDVEVVIDHPAESAGETGVSDARNP